MNDIFIRSIELPYSVNGMTVLDNNGDYNIYVNSLLSFESQKKTVNHEIKHVKKEHFYDFNPVIFNELEANA